MRRMMFVLLSIISGCSGSALSIDIDIGTNQSVNPLLDVEEKRDAGLNAGIRFVFDPLECTCNSTTGNCGPLSIDDVDATAKRVTYPSTSGPGMSATKETYEIDSNLLFKKKFYRVTMIAQDTISGQVTHSGKGDCPVNVSLGSLNRTTICFGVYDPNNPPVCTETRSFGSCPAAKSCD
jgi:hypothetical protein